MKISGHWAAAALVAVMLVFLSVLDLGDRSFSIWSNRHPFFTDALTGILVVLITVLILDRVVAKRVERNQSKAVSAQASVVMAQAVRTSRAVDAALAGSGQTEEAAHELRTYLTILSIGAPVLLGADISRSFLEAAQALGAEMSVAILRSDGSAAMRLKLDEALARARREWAPLLEIFDPEQELDLAHIDLSGH